MLVQNLLEAKCPSVIGEIIIHYFISESVMSHSRPQTSEKSDIHNIRFQFALACIQILDIAQKNFSLRQITKRYHIDNLNVFFHYILEQSSWMNYDFLELFVKNELPELHEASKVVAKYKENLFSFLKKFSILEISLAHILPRSFVSKCCLFRLLLNDSRHVSSALQVLRIKKSVAKRFNIPAKHVLINSIKHGSLLIEFAIEKTIWNEYPANSIAHTSVIWEEPENAFFI